MVSDYHSIVEEGVILFGKQWNKARKILRGNEEELSLVDSKTKLVLNYKPDVYFILRNNKKLIFEVLKSEEEKQDIIIADVIRSFLIDNVQGVIFIYPSGTAKVETRILEALKTIYKGLIKKGVKPIDLPLSNKSGAYAIRKKDFKNSNDVKNILIRFAKDDRW